LLFRTAATKRALGNVDPIDENDIWQNVAANLSRQPEKELATDLLQYARDAHTGTVKSLATAFQPQQQREAQGQEGTTLHRTFAAKRDERNMAQAAASAGQAAECCAAEARKAVGALKGSVRDKVQEAVRDTRQCRRMSRAMNPEDRVHHQTHIQTKRWARQPMLPRFSAGGTRRLTHV
jgi:hypothetical protein